MKSKFLHEKSIYRGDGRQTQPPTTRINLTMKNYLHRQFVITTIYQHFKNQFCD